MPGFLEGFARCGYGDVDIFLGGFVDGCDGLLVGGIDCVEGFAIDAFDEFVVDEPGQSVEADGTVGGTV